MTTSTARRLGRSRLGATGPGGRLPGATDGLGAEARASHLKNAARSAGEAFAHSADETDVAPVAARPWRVSSRAIWLTAGAAAACGLYLAY